jgi:hypothetical protein
LVWNPDTSIVTVDCGATFTGTVQEDGTATVSWPSFCGSCAMTFQAGTWTMKSSGLFSSDDTLTVTSNCGLFGSCTMTITDGVTTSATFAHMLIDSTTHQTLVFSARFRTDGTDRCTSTARGSGYVNTNAAGGSQLLVTN